MNNFSIGTLLTTMGLAVAGQQAKGADPRLAGDQYTLDGAGQNGTNLNLILKNNQTGVLTTVPNLVAPTTTDLGSASIAALKRVGGANQRYVLTSNLTNAPLSFQAAFKVANTLVVAFQNTNNTDIVFSPAVAFTDQSPEGFQSTISAAASQTAGRGYIARLVNPVTSVDGGQTVTPQSISSNPSTTVVTKELQTTDGTVVYLPLGTPWAKKLEFVAAYNRNEAAKSLQTPAAAIALK